MGEFRAAGNSEEGCRLAATERPDVILMDLEMPVLDRWEPVRTLKNDPQTRDIPIIGMSPYALESERGPCHGLRRVRRKPNRVRVFDRHHSACRCEPEIIHPAGQDRAPPGKHTVNTDPLPGSLATVTSPPIMRASLRAMARPSPVPPKRCAVVASAWLENSSNNFAAREDNADAHYRPRRTRSRDVAREPGSGLPGFVVAFRFTRRPRLPRNWSDNSS